tara:strand:- start:346 stop:834 length:489 start_codon:yes stop_codon:yes gene_type:complete
MKILALLICFLSFSQLKAQKTQAFIGSGGGINSKMEASPFLSFRHFFSHEAKGIGAELRYSQNYFNNFPDAYNLEASLLYGINWEVSAIKLYINGGFSGAIDLNQSISEEKRNPYLGSRVSSGFIYQDLIFDVSYLLVFKEVDFLTISPYRSSLSVGVGFCF